MVKWNEVLRIERGLGPRATFRVGRIYERLAQLVQPDHAQATSASLGFGR